MSTFPRAAAGALLTLVALGCTQVIPAKPPPEAPRVETFSPSKQRVAPGEAVTLSFSTRGATQVELVDDGGNAVQLEGTVAEGTASVAPARTTFYVLRATGPGGRDVAFLQVAVNEGVADVYLVAVPPVLEAGQEGQLLWGAKRGVTATLATGAGAPQALTGSTGVVTISPARSERYTLNVAGQAGTPALTAVTDVQVLPVLRDAALTASDGVEAGKTLRFTWRTAGADAVTVAEETFGPLTTVTNTSDVASGAFDYVLPALLPTGVAVGSGLPLRFTVRAVLGAETRSRTFDVVVGAPPVISRLTAPDAATQGSRFTVAWRTSAATRVTLSADGQKLFETREGEQARVADGQVQLPCPAAVTEYTFTASDGRGAKATRTFTVRPVGLPAINTFTLTAMLNAAGDQATAQWTTSNASRVELRFENGAQLAEVRTPGQVASGSATVALATGARLTLEAYNAAGDVVRQTKAVQLVSGAVRVTPTPVLRGGSYVLEWDLASLGVVDVVGLPTAPPTPVQASTRLIDLSTLASATELSFDDANDGLEALPLAPGFVFPLSGTPRPNLFVSVNGFIAFARPATGLASNTALSATSAPALLAPFWDDLTVPQSGKVLYALTTDPGTSEPVLVVQWNKVQLAGDLASELTFQAQLYESGQVTFVYGSMTGALTGATVGVKDTAAPAFAQEFTFNGAPGTVVTALELNFLWGGPATGTLTQSGAADRRINFFGRTASGLIALSAEVRAFGAGEVQVTEAMPQPASAVTTTGQWLELWNARDASVDFGGLVVTTNGSQPDGGFVIPPLTVVAPGGYLVLGQSTAAADNGGAPVGLVATDVPLSAAGSAQVLAGASPLSTLSWTASTPGESVQAPANVLVASGSTFTCPARTRTFGGLGSIGTPGAANEPCAPYLVSEVPGGYVDLTNGGTVLLAAESDYGAQGAFPLAAPFTYFGQTFTAFNVSLAAGFLSFGPALTSSYFSNNLTPLTTAPNAVVAPFWDDLVRNSGSNGSGKLLMRRDADRTIVSWQDFRIYADSGSHLFFQVHLVDPNIVEFHYGTLESGSTSQTSIDRARGNSATVWLENPAGDLAVPWSVNQPRITPNTGLRFTPVP